MRFLSFQSFLLATSLLVSPVVFASADEQNPHSVPTKKWEDFLENYAAGEPENLAGILVGMDKDNQERTFGALCVVLQDRLDNKRRDPERIQSILHSVTIDSAWAAENSASRFDDLMKSYSVPFSTPPVDEFSEELETSFSASAAPPKANNPLEELLKTALPATRQAFTATGLDFTLENISCLANKSIITYDDALDIDANLKILLKTTEANAREANLSVQQWARMSPLQIEAARTGTQQYQDYYYIYPASIDKAMKELLKVGGVDDDDIDLYLINLTTTPQVPHAFKRAGVSFDPGAVKLLAQKLDLNDFPDHPSDKDLLELLSNRVSAARRVLLPIQQWDQMSPEQLQAAQDVVNWTDNHFLTLNDAAGQTAAKAILHKTGWNEGEIDAYLAELTQIYSKPPAVAPEAPAAFARAGLSFTPETARELAQKLGRQIYYYDSSLVSLVQNAEATAQELYLSVSRWLSFSSDQITAATDARDWVQRGYYTLNTPEGNQKARQMLVDGGWQDEQDITSYLKNLENLPLRSWGANAPSAFETAGLPFMPKMIRDLAREIGHEAVSYYDSDLVRFFEEVQWARSYKGAKLDSPQKRQAAHDIDAWILNGYLNLQDPSWRPQAQSILNGVNWDPAESAAYLDALSEKYRAAPAAAIAAPLKAPTAFTSVGIAFTPGNMRKLYEVLSSSSSPKDFSDASLMRLFDRLEGSVSRTDLSPQAHLSKTSLQIWGAENVIDWVKGGYINPTLPAGKSFATRILKERGDWLDSDIDLYLKHLETIYAHPPQQKALDALMAFQEAGIDFPSPGQLYRLTDDNPSLKNLQWDYSPAAMMKILDFLKAKQANGSAAAASD